MSGLAAFNLPQLKQVDVRILCPDWQDVEAENLKSNVEDDAKKPQYKSLVSFTVDHAEPGKYTERELLLSALNLSVYASATPALRCWNSWIDH